MALLDTNLIKLRPDLEYLTGAERRLFQRLRAGRAITFFGTAVCAADGCSSEVPKSGKKRYCSKDCYDRSQGDHDAKEEDGKVD